MRALGAADETLPARAQPGIHKVDPGSSRVDDQLWLDAIFAARQFIAQGYAVAAAVYGADIIEAMTALMAGFGIQQHLQADAFGRWHPGVVIAGGAYDVRVQPRVFAQGGSAQAKVMPGQAGLLARQHVVERQPDLDHQGAAFAGPVQQIEELERGVQHARAPAEDGNGGAQRLGIVGRVLQHQAAFAQRFIDQAELAIFQVADAAVQHVRGAGAGAAAKVAAFNQQRVDAVDGQVAQSADAIDAAADDQHGDFWLFAQRVQDRLALHQPGWLTARIKLRPVISAGLAMPSRSSAVGATSASRPQLRRS